MAIVRLVDKRTGEEVLDGDMVDVATGESQAIVAAKLGNVGDLQLLHERHANFNYQDPDGWTALMTACATHHVDCALYLISCNVNLELAAKDGWTALMIAVDHNQEEIVKALLDAGAKTGRFNYSGVCELCIAAKYPRLAELLLEHGANPNQPHPKLPLVKPLFLTLSHRNDAHPDFVRALVKHGAEINAQTKEGQTPLMVSVMNAGITKVLLECGADPSFHDQDGETALDYAKKPGVDPMAYEILNKAMQKQDKDIERKDDTAIDEKVSLAEAEKNGTNGSIFTSETNCTINIDDIKSLTIFCDKYGTTLTVGDTQLIAWYKVNIKAGKQAKGAYAFDGYAYISGKDFLKLKPILLKRGWEFHSAKSGPPWFVEGESAVYPKEAEIPDPPVNEVQRIDDGIDSDNCAGKNEAIRVTTTSDQPQSTKDEDPTIEKKSTKRGCLVWLCVICLIAIIGGVVWLFKDELPKVLSDTFGSTTSKDKPTVPANQNQIVIEEPIKIRVSQEDEGIEKQREGEEERTREQQVAMQLLLQQKASAEQQKKQMIEASQAAKQAGADAYAVSEWEQGNVARKLGNNKFDAEAYEEAKKFYSEAENHFKMATELAVSNAEVRQQKKRMMYASQAAKEAGAKEYAVREWNKGVAAWNHGDDMAKAETYELAKEYYSKAENHFKTAELTANKVEAKKMLDALPSLEARATDLIRENDRWFKWSVDDETLVSTGRELYQVYIKYMNFVDKGLVADADNKGDMLKSLIIRCYEMASDDGNGEASYQLCLLYGGAENLIQHTSKILKRDDVAASKYLKRAASRGHDAAIMLDRLRTEKYIGMLIKDFKEELYKVAEIDESKLDETAARLLSVSNHEFNCLVAQLSARAQKSLKERRNKIRQLCSEINVSL